jgi:uncharacterized membrane-anchored protein
MLKILVATGLVALQVASFAQSSPSSKTPEQVIAELNWLQPGSIGRVGDKAEFKVTGSYTFLGAQDTDKFLQANGNPPQGGASYTIASTKSSWFGVLRFHPEGYVKDDEKIDADALLKSLMEQNVAGNDEKKKKGYQTLVLEGWFFPPRYDQETKRLEWGTKLRAEDNSPVVNVTTKVLGRGGYTSAILVSSPATMEADLLDFKQALKSFDYVSGEKYSEWKEGDKVAAYGLGALVLGGAAAVATSKGGLKVIFLAIAGAVAAVWAGIKKFVGRKNSTAPK